MWPPGRMLPMYALTHMKKFENHWLQQCFSIFFGLSTPFHWFLNPSTPLTRQQHFAYKTAIKNIASSIWCYDNPLLKYITSQIRSGVKEFQMVPPGRIYFQHCGQTISVQFSCHSLYLGMSDIAFFTDNRYTDIVQLLITDTDINRYRYMRSFFHVQVTPSHISCSGINTLCLILWCPTGCIHKFINVLIKIKTDTDITFLC